MLVWYSAVSFLSYDRSSIWGHSSFCYTTLLSTWLDCSTQLLSVRIWVQLWIRHFLCRRHFICPLQVYVGLSPPPPRHPCSHSPRGTLTEVQNWSRRNTLRNHVLPRRDEFPDPLKACFPPYLLQWRVGLDPIPLSPRLPPRETPHHPVMESIQGPLHPRVKHPRLCPEK